MKKLFSSAAILAVLACLFMGCSNSTNNNAGGSGDGNGDSASTKEKVKLYKSFVGEYEGEYETASVTIAENYFIIDGTRITLDPEKDLYTYNELPAGTIFEDKYDIKGFTIGNSVQILHWNKIFGKEDKDTVLLNDWLEKYYYDDEDLYREDSSDWYKIKEENPEWYQKCSETFYDSEKDVLYHKNYERKKYLPLNGYSSNSIFYCGADKKTIIAFRYDYQNKFCGITTFEEKNFSAECSIRKISDYKLDRVVSVESDDSFLYYEDNEGNYYTTIDPVNSPSVIEEMVEEFFAEEINASGESIAQWKSDHIYEWRAKEQEYRDYYANKEETLTKSYDYAGIQEKSLALKKKSSGNSGSGSDDDDDDDDDNGSGSSGSIDASEFEGYTWKYSKQGASATTTQNVVFENGTITVKTITTSNNSGTSHQNREETASYELDGDKITITYESGSYDVTAEYTISVDGNSLTLEGKDNDANAISVLGTLFQNTSGTASITFKKD